RPAGAPLAALLRPARPAAGDHRHGDRIRHRAGQRDVVSGLGAVAIHAGEQYLTGAPFDRLACPGDGVAPRGVAAAVGVDPPAVALAARVDRDHDALLAEALG